MTSATVATKPAAAQSGQSQAKPEKIRKDHSINWWLTAAVAVLSLTVLVPLYFAVVTALKTPGEAGTFSLPTTWEWHNFADAWNKVNYPKAALNSAIITVCAVVLTLLTNTFVAYAVARNMDKRFFRFLYYFFLAMMFVPFTVVMLPIAKEMGSLHLDNQLGLIVLYTILGIGTNLFIAIGFIRSIPISLEEAAAARMGRMLKIRVSSMMAAITPARMETSFLRFFMWFLLRVLQVCHGVDVGPAVGNAEVQVGASGNAGTAHIANQLSLGDGLPLGYHITGHVHIDGGEAVSMVD